MRKSVLFAFLFIILSGLVLVSPVHFSLAQNSTSFKISGYILDSNGYGIGGAQIIFNVPSVVPSVLSDSSGYYVISAPAGTYQITVWPPFDSNFIHYDQPVFVVESDITKNIILELGHKVSGYISDSLGNPVSGAVVSLNGFFSGWFSDYFGYYFVNVPAGTYNLSVTPRFGYDHFSSYFESNFAVNGETTKNITVSDHSPPPSPSPWEPFLDPSPSSTSMMWNRTYGGSPYETAESVIETSDGGFAIAGWRWYYEGMLLVKTDKFGNMEWVQTYGKNEVAHDGANSVIETSDGGYALAGARRFGKSGYNDFLLVKTDAYGNMEWNQTYGGADGDAASSVVETSDGGYALAGRTNYRTMYTVADSWLVKTDSHGNMEWNHTYGKAHIYSSYSVVKTSDGGFALAGGEFLVKTDANGNMEWNQTYGGTERHLIYSLVETSDGGYVLAGYYGNFDEPGQADFWLIKTDEHGIIPEFPSWIILPLVITASLVTVLYKRRLTKKPNQQ